MDIGFEQDEYTVREGETVRICAQMSATSGLISVPLVVNIISLTVQRASIAAPQATDGLDLIDVDEGLTFLPGRQNERHCVNITTLTDDVYEGTEVRRIHLVRDPPDVTLDPDVAMIHILDNNGTDHGCWGRGRGIQFQYTRTRLEQSLRAQLLQARKRYSKAVVETCLCLSNYLHISQTFPHL